MLRRSNSPTFSSSDNEDIQNNILNDSNISFSSDDLSYSPSISLPDSFTSSHALDDIYLPSLGEGKNAKKILEKILFTNETEAFDRIAAGDMFKMANAQSAMIQLSNKINNGINDNNSLREEVNRLKRCVLENKEDLRDLVGLFN
jgi:hypothetical protein